MTNASYRSYTEKGANPEGGQSHSDHRGHDVDEPVGQERCDPQKHNVAEDVLLLAVDLT